MAAAEQTPSVISVFMPYLALPVFALIGAIAYLAYSRNVAAKRIVLPVVLVGVGLMFFVMVWATPGLRQWWIVFVAAAVLVLTYRSVRFCQSCGVTVKGKFLVPALHCPNCGALLNADS